MRVADLNPGWRTDFIVHRFGAEIVERDAGLVVRTPTIPTFYWGNCLILPSAPADEDVGHWLRRFEEEIGARQPLSRHVAIGINEPRRGRTYPAWQAAGFDICEHHLLRLEPGALVAPARAARGDVQIRPIDFADDRFEAAREAVIDVEATDVSTFEPEGHRRYLRQQWNRYRPMHAAGLLMWFGAWCDGTLAASCGLIRDAVPGATASAPIGRFQRVVTHSGWRRRGLCSALVHAVSRHAIESWGCREVYMVADPGDIAIGIYRSLGYVDVEADFAFQRNAPEDRGR